MLVYLLAAVGLCLLLLLYHYLPNKKIFACFCLTLLLAGAIAYKFWPAPDPTPAPISEQERYELMQQQQIFAAWYADYQRDLDELDRNWRWYHQIIENFKSDNISIQTTFVRLKQLDQDSQQLRDRIALHAPPVALNDGCYDLLTEVVNKTNAYADAQYRTIALTRAAADPANLKTDNQSEQSRMLQTIMIRESPVGLYTAKEITAIRQYLDIPEEKRE
jgi:hypothetical protein